MEVKREWRLGVAWTEGENGERIPIGAPTMRERVPLRKYHLGDKFRKHKSLNASERIELQEVCSINAEQPIACFGPYDWYDNGFSIPDLKCYCANCPYSTANTTNNQKKNCSIWFPNFVEEYLKSAHMELNYETDPRWHVYFVTDTQYVKIGKGNDQNNRIGQLQTGNPRIIQLLFKIYVNSEYDAYTLEHFLHETYKGYRMCGEWFDIYDSLAIEAWRKSIITADYDGERRDPCSSQDS